jgi:hypothetical protein
MKALRHILFNKIDATGLAVFRICFMAVLIYEISQFYEFRNLIYDKIPFVETGEFNIRYLFHFWFVVAALLLIGAFTRTVTIINWIFCVIVFGCLGSFNYAVFGVYTSVSFLMMFMPVSNVLSIDSLIKKQNSKVLAVNYLAPVFLAIGFIYFDSALHKLCSPMWLKGLGVWLPSSIPMITHTNLTWILNNEFLIKLNGYLILLFETVFIFLFWFKPFRVPFLVLGVVFHLGILIAFPIPSFAMAMIAMYILMVPVKWWSFLKVKSVEVIEDNLLFDRLTMSKYFWKATLVITAALFTLVSYSAPLPQKILHRNNIKLINVIERHTKRYLGIQQYKIFTDWAYEGYNQVYKIEHDGKLIPIFDNNGQPIGFNKGVIWNNLYLITKKEKIEAYVPYCKYWLLGNNIELKGKIVFYRSEVTIPVDWSKDFLKKELGQSWKRVAVYDLSVDKWE